ncbi:DUF2235 domain-containing protein [Ectothiorhodospira sp. BSL-9]|uniref:DUF2235 domain-containing protein n=1 Tax=Ectothiorhodospira sp. BSL-9 TaxID=1442136 RepID=UPI000AF44310|nr:DUF2235 domain-containing protein [Ectothiorhodospira sp. BSL-9]
MTRKRLVVCCDGTWAKEETQTHIFRLFGMIPEEPANDAYQLKHYVSGVGSSRWTRFRGGAFGFGLNENLQRAYNWLVEHYEPGDEIFCFGFSRGAYTARSLCGMIGTSGLFCREHQGETDLAMNYYRVPPERRPQSRQHRQLQRIRRHPEETLSVRMLGVFDTVGALGVPIPALASFAQGGRRVNFHDTTLGPLVENAFHALAIDEQRGPFKPTLWTLADGDASTPPQARRFDGSRVDQQVVQAWFPGVHSDVGGGYDNKALADVPFLWMLREAQALGLHIEESMIEECLSPNPFAPAHDSLNLQYKLTAYWPWIDDNRPRLIGAEARHRAGLGAARNAMVHQATLDRIEQASQLPPKQSPYRPLNLVNPQGELIEPMDVANTR